MTARSIHHLPVLLVLSLSISCTASAPTPAETPAPAQPAAITEAEVQQGVRDLSGALVAGDAAKASGQYAADATFVNARGKFDTRADIEAFWAGAIKGGAGKNLNIELMKWGASGDLAYSVSRFTGGITAPSGHVLAVTQRQADGSHKIVAQVSIPDPPAAK